MAQLEVGDFVAVANTPGYSGDSLKATILDLKYNMALIKYCDNGREWIEKKYLHKLKGK